MKVLILYAKIGGGHLKAAEAIKEAFERNYKNVNVVLNDGMEALKTRSLSNKVLIKSYLSITKYTPDIWRNIYNMSDKMDNSALKELYDLISKTTLIRLKKMFKQEQPDIIISTHPFVTKMISYLKNKGVTNAKLVTVITDYEIHTMWIDGHKKMDRIFVATDKMKRDCISYGVDKNKVIASGIPISNKFNEKYDKKKITQELGFNYNKRIFLFFAGGGLGVGKSKKIFKDLLKQNQDTQIIAIAGRNKKQAKFFEKVSKGYDNVKTLGYVDNVPELMYVSDLVITKPGGITSTECMVMNKPMIIINPIPGQEENNARFFTNNGTALWLYEDDYLYDMLYIIDNNPLRLIQIKQMCQKIAKPYAADEIVKSTYNLIKGE